MNPLTHLKKILILPVRTFLSLGAIFALVTAAHAQNLYVSANRPQSLGGHAILEFTPSGVQSTYASGLENPRGLAFDGIGNLFAAEILNRDDIDLGRVLKFNLRNKVSTVGSAAHFGFVGLATDMAGNAYVMATDDNSPVGAGTIFKFTPDGDRLIFGAVPGTTGDNLLQANEGLAFDSAGYLYAADGGAQTIYKFAPDGTRTVFAGPSAFATGAYPFGLAFDSTGNLFVSTVCFAPFFCDPGSDTILRFTPNGMESTFATDLTNPRGLAFDGSGSLCSRGKSASGRRYLEVRFGRNAHRLCLRLRPPAIPHLRAAAITPAHRTPLNSDDHFDLPFSLIAMKEITSTTTRTKKI